MAHAVERRFRRIAYAGIEGAAMGFFFFGSLSSPRQRPAATMLRLEASAAAKLARGLSSTVRINAPVLPTGAAAGMRTRAHAAAPKRGARRQDGKNSRCGWSRRRSCLCTLVLVAVSSRSARVCVCGVCGCFRASGGVSRSPSASSVRRGRAPTSSGVDPRERPAQPADLWPGAVECVDAGGERGPVCRAQHPAAARLHRRRHDAGARL